MTAASASWTPFAGKLLLVASCCAFGMSCESVLGLGDLVYDLPSSPGGGAGAGGAGGDGVAEGGAAGGTGGGAGQGGGPTGGAGGAGSAAGAGGTGGQGGTGGTGGGVTTPTCYEQYGQVPEYEECSQTATACEFYVYANYTSCANVCALNGGTCLEAWNDTPGDHCVHNGVVGCSNDTKLGLVCRCTRG